MAGYLPRPRNTDVRNAIKRWDAASEQMRDDVLTKLLEHIYPKREAQDQ